MSEHRPVNEMTIEEIASEIDARLQKIEGSKRNKLRGDHTLFYHACARMENKASVRVLYVSYQGSSLITLAEAGWYLEILRKGFIGSHHSAFHEHGEPNRGVENEENLFTLAETARRPKFHDDAGKEFPAATRAFYRLVEATTMLVNPKAKRSVRRKFRITGVVPDTGDFYPTGLCPEIRGARPEVRDGLNLLWREVAIALRKSGEFGRQRGNNLIVELAKGRVTADQLHGSRKQ